MVVRPELKGFTYIRLRELVFEAFTGIVPDLARNGTHSLRSGGATASSTLFTSRRWSSVPAKAVYVKDSSAPLLSVSKALGF